VKIEELKEGNTVVVEFGDSIQYKRIAVVRRVLPTQLIVCEEGTKKEERFYRTGPRAGGRYGAYSKANLVILSPEDLAELRKAKAEIKEKVDSERAAAEFEASKPRNIALRRIANSVEDRWEKLSTEELLQIERLLYGEDDEIQKS
jgi:hypothetical protein